MSCQVFLYSKSCSSRSFDRDLPSENFAAFRSSLHLRVSWNLSGVHAFQQLRRLCAGWHTSCTELLIKSLLQEIAHAKYARTTE
jgi:hypothetical protein